MRKTSDRYATWMRIVACGLGSIAAAFWLLSLILSGLSDVLSGRPPEAPVQGAILTGLVAASAVGVAIAWRSEQLGGTVLLVSAMALGVFTYLTAGHNKPLAVSISAGPFLLAAILFLANSARSSGPAT